MLPTPRNYAIYPSVVPADTPVEMTIVPVERSFLFFFYLFIITRKYKKIKRP